MKRKTEKNRINKGSTAGNGSADGVKSVGIRKLLRTVVLLVMLLGAWLVLTAGIFSKPATLKNAKEPFIDLDSTIADVDTGKGGNSETGLEDDEGKEDASSKEESEVVVQLRIEIREETITIDGTEIKPEYFENNFKTRYRDGVEVVLVDDYAEYHTYKQVKDSLKEKGIKPVEEQN